jgi:SAM-dependent methyltransferase
VTGFCWADVGAIGVASASDADVPSAILRRRRGRYAEHRPGYPAAALDWALAPIAGAGSRERTLLDLGAGTGKLTTALLGRGTVIAIEPDPAMLAELRRRLPDIDAREGSAESIPLPTGSVDTVLVGQAWHWFDTGRAAGAGSGAASGWRAGCPVERR